MADEMKHPTPPKLPGDHGQFGTADSTEDYKRMKDSPKPTPDANEVDRPAPSADPASSAGGSQRPG